MTYFDPLSSYDPHHVLRGIQSFEEKLRLRKQITRDLNLHGDHIGYQPPTNQLLYEEQMRLRRAPELYYDYQIRTPAADRFAAQQIKDSLQEEQHTITHLEKLRRLQMEKLQLSRERLGAGFAGAYSNTAQRKEDFGYIAYDEDDILLKKYQDGTRAREYQDQLQTHNNTRRNIYDSYGSPLKKPRQEQYRDFKGHQNYKTGGVGLNSHQLYNTGTKSMYNRSPYTKLNAETAQKMREHEVHDIYEGQTGKFLNTKVASHLKQNNQDESEHLPSKTITFAPKQSVAGKKQMKVRSKSQTKLNISREKYGSPAFHNYLQDIENKRMSVKSKKSPKKINKSTRQLSALERSRSIVSSLQTNALKKIDNRLRLSEVVFEDSKFRNIKHQVNHLQMTFENEIKLRRDMKDKINNHPLILRKHAMVVQ